VKRKANFANLILEAVNGIFCFETLVSQLSSPCESGALYALLPSSLVQILFLKREDTRSLSTNGFVCLLLAALLVFSDLLLKVRRVLDSVRLNYYGATSSVPSSSLTTSPPHAAGERAFAGFRDTGRRHQSRPSQHFSPGVSADNNFGPTSPPWPLLLFIRPYQAFPLLPFPAPLLSS